MIFFQIVFLVFLLGVSACFSLVEAAITTLSALRMKKIVVLSPRLAPLFTEWLASPHRLLSVLMVGNSLVSVSFSSLAAVAAVPLNAYFSPSSVSWMVWGAVTVSLVVVGEIVPKIIGRAYRERVAAGILPFFSRVTRGLFMIWGPVGWAIKRWTPVLHRAPVNPLTVVSLEELQHAVSESQAEGYLPPDSGEMFARALAMTQRTAREVAQPADRIDALALEILNRPNGADLFVDLLVETGRTRVPVTRGGRFVGYLNAMDFLSSVRSGRVPPIEAMVRPLRRVHPDTKALDLLEEFRKKGDGIALVGPSDTDVGGILTLEDVLEELVGEILDEYDREEAVAL
jgi:putative hemolysin